MNIKNGWGGCKKCRRAAQSVQQRNPEADAIESMRAAGLEPLGPYLGRQKPWLCRCLTCGNEISPRLDTVLSGQRGCRWCARRAVDPAAAAEIMRKAGLEVLSPYPGAGLPWPCRCATCGKEVTPSYNSVRRGHAGCKWCSWRENNGKTQRLNAEVAATYMAEQGLLPLGPYPGSRKPWPCQCTECGTEVAPTYSNIKSGWGGCWTCRGTAQSLKQRRPESIAVAAMRAAGVEPVEPFRSSHKPWLGRCLTCGKTVSPTLGSIEAGQRACKWCAQAAVDPEEAATYMRAAGLEPLVDYPGRHTPWSCHCLGCSRTVAPRYGSIRAGQGGCRQCGGRGFNPEAEAILYLIAHRMFDAAKIGITAADSGRLAVHAKLGWEMLTQVKMPGLAALSVEHNILNWWRKDLDLPPFLGGQEMPQGGWTETVELDAIDIPATIERIRTLAAA
jgi:recombinational DNA repair protein (RecF pathway)